MPKKLDLTEEEKKARRKEADRLRKQKKREEERAGLIDLVGESALKQIEKEAITAVRSQPRLTLTDAEKAERRKAQYRASKEKHKGESKSGREYDALLPSLARDSVKKIERLQKSKPPDFRGGDVEKRIKDWERERDQGIAYEKDIIAKAKVITDAKAEAEAKKRAPLLQAQAKKAAKEAQSALAQVATAKVGGARAMTEEEKKAKRREDDRLRKAAKRAEAKVSSPTALQPKTAKAAAKVAKPKVGAVNAGEWFNSTFPMSMLPFRTEDKIEAVKKAKASYTRERNKAINIGAASIPPPAPDLDYTQFPKSPRTAPPMSAPFAFEAPIERVSMSSKVVAPLPPPTQLEKLGKKGATAGEKEAKKLAAKQNKKGSKQPNISFDLSEDFIRPLQDIQPTIEKSLPTRTLDDILGTMMRPSENNSYVPNSPEYNPTSPHNNNFVPTPNNNNFVPKAKATSSKKGRAILTLQKPREDIIQNPPPRQRGMPSDTNERKGMLLQAIVKLLTSIKERTQMLRSDPRLLSLEDRYMERLNRLKEDVDFNGLDGSASLFNALVDTEDALQTLMDEEHFRRLERHRKWDYEEGKAEPEEGELVGDLVWDGSKFIPIEPINTAFKSDPMMKGREDIAKSQAVMESSGEDFGTLLRQMKVLQPAFDMLPPRDRAVLDNMDLKDKVRRLKEMFSGDPYSPLHPPTYKKMVSPSSPPPVFTERPPSPNYSPSLEDYYFDPKTKAKIRTPPRRSDSVSVKPLQDITTSPPDVRDEIDMLFDKWLEEAQTKPKRTDVVPVADIDLEEMWAAIEREVAKPTYEATASTGSSSLEADLEQMWAEIEAAATAPPKSGKKMRPSFFYGLPDETDTSESDASPSPPVMPYYEQLKIDPLDPRMRGLYTQTAAPSREPPMRSPPKSREDIISDWFDELYDSIPNVVKADSIQSMEKLKTELWNSQFDYDLNKDEEKALDTWWEHLIDAQTAELARREEGDDSDSPSDDDWFENALAKMKGSGIRNKLSHNSMWYEDMIYGGSGKGKKPSAAEKEALKAEIAKQKEELKMMKDAERETIKAEKAYEKEMVKVAKAKAKEEELQRLKEAKAKEKVFFKSSNPDNTFGARGAVSTKHNASGGAKKYSEEAKAMGQKIKAAKEAKKEAERLAKEALVRKQAEEKRWNALTKEQQKAEQDEKYRQRMEAADKRSAIFQEEKRLRELQKLREVNIQHHRRYMESVRNKVYGNRMDESREQRRMGAEDTLMIPRIIARERDQGGMEDEEDRAQFLEKFRRSAKGKADEIAKRGMLTKMTKERKERQARAKEMRAMSKEDKPVGKGMGESCRMCDDEGCWCCE